MAYFKKEEDIRPLFESQLEICGVDYFDFYLMHAQSAEIFKHFKACRAYETAFELKKEGKIRHVGISFHDRAEVLDEILREYPQIEVVQIQLNYVDFDDPAVQSRKCYGVCRKHGKPVIVMEPVKGGSPARYTIRFAAGFPGILMVLSGMSDIKQMKDNISFMQNFQPLTDTEMEAVRKVQDIFRFMHRIACTACRCCTDGCPQHLPIRELLEQVAAELKKKEEPET